jgi:hypothetical protein
MLYNTLQKPPPKGSLQEWVLILYLDRVEAIEHAKFRALAQILLVAGSDDQSAGTEAFEDYMKQAFPNAETRKKKKQEDMMNALKEWVGLGALGVTPMPMLTTKGKSKMVSRISGVETGVADAVTKQVGGIRSRE